MHTGILITFGCDVHLRLEEEKGSLVMYALYGYGLHDVISGKCDAPVSYPESTF